MLLVSENRKGKINKGARMLVINIIDNSQTYSVAV